MVVLGAVKNFNRKLAGGQYVHQEDARIIPIFQNRSSTLFQKHMNVSHSLNWKIQEDRDQVASICKNEYMDILVLELGNNV